MERCTDKRVLKTVSIMITKNPIARSACWDRRTDTYITSIVLIGYEGLAVVDMPY